MPFRLAKIVAFGDSITRGYGVPAGDGWVELLPALMQGQAGGGIQIINAGGNGNTSTEGLQRIDAEVLRHMPGLVLVEFGGNDAVHDARAVSVAEYERNLLIMIEKVRDRGGEIVLLTFPPVVNEWHATRSDAYYARLGGLDQCIEQYRQRTRELSSRAGCRLIDLDHSLREAMVTAGRQAIIAEDGVHLTAEANTLVARLVLKALTGG